MTVKELVAELKKLPQTADVQLAVIRGDEGAAYSSTEIVVFEPEDSGDNALLVALEEDK